jgi:hypothetical protein
VYPPVPLLVVTAGAARFPGGAATPPTGPRFGTNLPADMQAQPVVQVRRFGGAVHVPSLDPALCDVEVWAADETAVESLSQQVRNWLMHELPGQTVTTTLGAAVIARVQEMVGPGRRPTGDPDLYRVGASYRITTHSH